MIPSQTTTSQGWKSRFPAVDFEIREPDDPNGVPGSYIVRLHVVPLYLLQLANSHPKIMLKTDSDLKAHMDWLRSRASSMKSEDIKIASEFNALNGYSAELTDDGISTIAASPDVKCICQNSRVSIC
ncbi:hypothetical protein FRC12_000143 [Ceratobasidium sp. 428]|nr:hypothetical protein FRC12_000143 [Ceratobasidium sp. 428]